MTCVQSWKLYNFGSYAPIKKAKDVAHTVIQITYDNGEIYVYEWGDEMPYNNFTKNGDYYKYPGDRTWFGVDGQSGVVPHGLCITQQMIDAENENWRDEHGAGGHYPNNCRGYAHYIIRYMMGSNDPDTHLPSNDPAYNSTCASSEYKYKRKEPDANNANNRKSKKSKKRGGKKTTLSKILKRSQHTMKIKRTKQ